MLDFTSALYLGLRHPAVALQPWAALTTGQPAALQVSRDALVVANQLAALQGFERALLATSTLHLFWDLFGLLARERVRIYMDRDTYAIARWGAERASALGAPVRRFAHLDAASAGRMIERDDPCNARPIVLTDGFCPFCGTPAPIDRYLDYVAPRGGYVVVDDSQALGVLGARPSHAEPFGRGGGGSLKFQGIESPRVIAGSSLAKAFGAPIAVLAANSEIVRDFEKASETRIHCSPPSAAVIHAAGRALAVNRAFGDRWRRHLATLILRLRGLLRDIGVAVSGRLFPVLTIRQRPGAELASLQQRLSHQGIGAVMTRGCSKVGTGISLMLTALHDVADVDHAALAIGRATIVQGSLSTLKEEVS